MRGMRGEETRRREMRRKEEECGVSSSIRPVEI
jgi:hypothetical protein